MVDLGSIQAALGSIKAMTDITNALLQLKIGSEVQSKVIELNAKILSAQTDAAAALTDQFTLLEQVSDLKKQIAELETWNTEKQRYQLTEIGAGVFAYTLKPGVDDAGPAHKICEKCYGDRHVSVLQAETRMPGRISLLVCHNCGSELVLSGARGPENPPPKINRGVSRWSSSRARG